MFMFLMDAFAWIFVIVVGACLAYFALLGVFIGVAKVVGKLWKERRVLSVWTVLFAAALALSFVEDVTRVVILMCVASPWSFWSPLTSDIIGAAGGAAGGDADHH